MKKRFKPAKGFVWQIENDPQKREQAIKNDFPVRFQIERNQSLDTGSKFWDDLRTFDFYGKRVVRKYNDKILKHAARHNVDPDLIRSVMFAENARGHYLGLNEFADAIKKSNSIFPMNIQNSRWASLIDKEPDDLYDSDNNIEAATVLIRRIADRLDRPTPEKVGSIWNYTGRQKTNEFGEYIAEVYRQKPWREID